MTAETCIFRFPGSGSGTQWKPALRLPGELLPFRLIAFTLVRRYDRPLLTRGRNMTITRYVTIGDCVLIAALIFLAVALLFVLPATVASGGTRVVVRAGDRVAGRYSLEEDRRVTVSGPLGNTVIRIENGRAHIESSPLSSQVLHQNGRRGIRRGTTGLRSQ